MTKRGDDEQKSERRPLRAGEPDNERIPDHRPAQRGGRSGVAEGKRLILPREISRRVGALPDYRAGNSAGGSGRSQQRA
jgi:hypothetical protein